MLKTSIYIFENLYQMYIVCSVAYIVCSVYSVYMQKKLVSIIVKYSCCSETAGIFVQRFSKRTGETLILFRLPPSHLFDFLPAKINHFWQPCKFTKFHQQKANKMILKDLSQAFRYENNIIYLNNIFKQLLHFCQQEERFNPILYLFK